MFEVIGALILLLVAAIYSAIVVGRRTDQRILNLIDEDSVETPMLVRYPEDVLRPREDVRPSSTVKADKRPA